MDTLENTYLQKRSRYDSLIAQNDPTKVTEIKSLNSELAALLQKMLVEVSRVKEDAGKIDTYRNELIAKLIKVQNDHNIMLQQKDQLETLKLLQGHEKVKFDATFFWYAFFLGVVSIAFVLVLMWKGHKAPAMPAMISSPAMTPPLMYR